MIYMLKLEKILVPTDFSAGAKLALAYAASFCLEYGADLYLLHVIEEEKPDIVGLEDPLNIVEKWRQKNESEARVNMQQHMARIAPGLEAKMMVEVGSSAEVIQKIAETEKINLIVMGAYGSGGSHPGWLGNTAYDVVRKAPCPVFTVKPQEHDFITG